MSTAENDEKPKLWFFLTRLLFLTDLQFFPQNICFEHDKSWLISFKFTLQQSFTQNGLAETMYTHIFTVDILISDENRYIYIIYIYWSSNMFVLLCLCNTNEFCSLVWQTSWVLIPMMTSLNGNIFRITGPLCGEFTGHGEFPAKRPVTRSFDVVFYLCLNKRLSKQWWGRWIESPSRSLWAHAY